MRKIASLLDEYSDIQVLDSLVYILRKISYCISPSNVQVVLDLGLLSKLNALLDIDSESIRSNITLWLVNITAPSADACKLIIDLKLHLKIMGFLSKPGMDCYENVRLGNG